VKFNAVIQHKFFKPALGAALTVAAGIALWALPLGEGWRLASYDSLFRFATRPVTNKIAIVFMDNDSFERTGQSRSNGWDRAHHASFLDRLTRDGCPLVVFDVFFVLPAEPAATRLLVESIERSSNVVLAAKQTNVYYHLGPGHPSIFGKWPKLLPENFLDAVRQTNWGVGNVDTNRDGVVRQHWRFPSPGIYDSVAWTAANLAGAQLSDDPQERWIRYYAPGWAWTSLSYVEAEAQPTDYFRDKIVFIGNKPEDDLPNGEKDEFSTPFTDETGGSVSGVEILATQFLNLFNHEWLRTPPAWMEILVLVISGALLGSGLCWRGKGLACLLAGGTAFMALVTGVWLSYFTNYWFPWLIVAGGQVPCALACALAAPRIRFGTKVIPQPADPSMPLPVAPDYELFDPPFGEGAYGRVWVARNAVGQWQALKAVYQAKFGQNAQPYEREMKGIERYKPVSDKHPGLLRVDFVSRAKPEGYFYYVMELGDAQLPGWENNPASYKPRDLASVRAQAVGGQVPIPECVRIGLALADALEFLHQNDLTHRDIKPQNIVFLNGQPKLADVGLVAEIRPAGQERTWVGTLGYMPPPPEPPGTPQADIYGLGMVLYVISTGRDPVSFPELSTTLVEQHGVGFMRLNSVILRACDPDRAQRFASAAEMREALREVQDALDREASAPRA